MAVSDKNNQDIIQEKYEAAVATILQIPAIYEEVPEMERNERVLKLMPDILERAGIKVSDLDTLNVIHVAGSKGKGSVCTMCESILRSQGLKTGFLSSPHLLEVRERIRINGVPLSKELFVKYFNECYELLIKDKEEPMPSFTRLYFVMAMKAFLAEKVDVAVIEVGRGGRFDYTNVLQKPIVCGITCLGYEHVELFGNTIAEIAWQKAGICKPGVPVFTANQPVEALEMILSCSKELNVSSVAVAPHSSVYPDSDNWSIGISGDHQLENASLSVQLCRQWMKDMGMWSSQEEEEEEKSNDYSIIPYASTFSLPQSFIKGLKECFWPGRCQVVKREGVTYYLDVAHTVESLNTCSKWFQKASSLESSNIQGPVEKVLLFNFLDNRNPYKLIPPVAALHFDHAIFAPNLIYKDVPLIVDHWKFTVEPFSLLKERCQINENLWRIYSSNKSCDTYVFDCVSDVIKWVETQIKQRGVHLQILVCGSVRMVGITLTTLGYTV